MGTGGPAPCLLLCVSVAYGGGLRPYPLDVGKLTMGYFGTYKHKWFCRWCGTPYVPVKVERDGFCCNACEMALYRARKKYVSRSRRHVGRSADLAGQS